MIAVTHIREGDIDPEVVGGTQESPTKVYIMGLEFMRQKRR